jgi:hypothetical protein
VGEPDDAPIIPEIIVEKPRMTVEAEPLDDQPIEMAGESR